MSQADRGTRMCMRLHAAVAAVVPPGLGEWDEVWTLTAEVDRRWMRALKAWEENENPATVAALKAAFDEFVAAWKTAALLWEREQAA